MGSTGHSCVILNAAGRRYPYADDSRFKSEGQILCSIDISLVILVERDLSGDDGEQVERQGRHLF